MLQSKNIHNSYFLAASFASASASNFRNAATSASLKCFGGSGGATKMCAGGKAAWALSRPTTSTGEATTCTCALPSVKPTNPDASEPLDAQMQAETGCPSMQ